MPFNKHIGSMMILEFNAVAAKGKTPTLAEVKKHFQLADNEIDAGFGVVPIRNVAGKTTFYANVTAEAGRRLEKQKPAGFVKSWVKPRKQLHGK